jgi:hypothetical protein
MPLQTKRMFGITPHGCLSLCLFACVFFRPSVHQYYHVEAKTRLFQKFFFSARSSLSYVILRNIYPIFSKNFSRFLARILCIIYIYHFLKKFFSARSSLRRILSVALCVGSVGTTVPTSRLCVFIGRRLPFYKKTQSLPSSRLCGLILIS